jgi:membrane fusion protein, multidrug efflux system
MSKPVRRATASTMRWSSLLMLGLVTACGGPDAEATDVAPVTQQIGVENVAIAQTDSIVGGPLLSGALVPEREARIRAEVSGRVTATLVDAGQRVSAGTVLARIDDASLRDDVLSARSGLTTAELVSTQADRELERARTLVAAGAIATRDVEAAERAALQAKSALDDAKARVSAREKALANTVIRASFSGVVSERQVNAGDVVAPGASLFTVVDPSSLRLEGSVPATAVGRVSVGARVDFTVNGYADRAFTGRVSQVNPVADAVTRQVRIIASLPNSSGTLVGGLFAEGRVATESHAGVVVPEAAVDQRGVTPYAIRIRGGVVERVDVTLGVRDAARERVEILSGVAVGDTLLVGAAKAISVGSPVRVSEPSDAARGTAPDSQDR